MSLKDLGTFCNTKQNVHIIIYINLTTFQDNDNVKLTLKYFLLRCCGFWEVRLTSHKNNVRLSDEHNFSMSNVFSWHCITHFSKIAVPQQVII